MISLDKFTTFATTAINGPSGADSTISVSEDGNNLNAGRWQRLGTRTAEFKAQNLSVRTQFLKVISDTFGGLDSIPKSVKDVMKMGDFGLDRDGNVTSHRPLTARRILAITAAVREAVPGAIAEGLATPHNQKTIARLAGPEAKIQNALGFASTQEMKEYVARRIETLYSTAQQVGLADIKANAGHVYSRAVTGMGALIDILSKRLETVDRDSCRKLFDNLIDRGFSGQFFDKRGCVVTRNKMESIVHGQLDMLDEMIAPLDDGCVNELERVMKIVTPDHANTFEGIIEAYENTVDLLASTGEGGISNYVVARFQDMMPRPALIQCNPNNKSYKITVEDLAKDTPLAKGELLSKWLAAGLGENDTVIDSGTGVGSLANDLPRAVNGDFSFTIGSGEGAINIDGKVTRNKGQQTVDESLQVSKNILNTIKNKFPKATDAQRNIVMQALSQNSLAWARTFLFPGAEHAAGHFTVEEVSGSTDIKVSFKAKETRGSGFVQNYSQSYVIHADGTSVLVALERTKDVI